MMPTAVTLTAEYRARGYTAEDEALLRSAFSDLGAVRLRPLQLPEAGGSAEMWIVLSFIAIAARDGLIGHITGKLYDRVSAAFLQLFRSRASRDESAPEMTLRVSYDDVDIDIGPVGESDILRLPRIAANVHDRLHKSPLLGREITRIVLGMVREGEYWEEPRMWNQSSDGARFWGISLEGHRAVTHILDTHTNLLSERPCKPNLASPEDVG